MKEMTVFVGPTHGSKSTGALHIARRNQRLGKTVVLVRPKRSVRAYEQYGTLSTKNGETFPSHDIDTPGELSFVEDVDMIWVDEPFLFTFEQELLDFINRRRKRSEILVSSLGADCFLRPFGNVIPQLLASADKIVQCFADCDSCGEIGKATRTLALVDIKPGGIKVGATESFSACCPECWTYLLELPVEKRVENYKRNK